MYYFASDIHLGPATVNDSRQRELLFVNWLDEVSADARAIFIVGDMFDFWYEYRRVVPKGFTRLLGKLSSLTDSGVEIHFFPGNHDMWAYDYLKEECGVNVHHYSLAVSLYGKMFYITHGDDVAAKRSGFLTHMMNAIFRSPTARWFFSRFVHPDVAMKIGHVWSNGSRKSKSVSHFFLAENEPMVRFAREYSAAHNIDYFVFGHNHCAEIYPLDNTSTAVFLGEWIERPTYAVLSPSGVISLHLYPAEE